MKSILFVLSAFIILSSCNNQKTANVSDLDKQFIGAWNAKDTSKINPFLADDVQFIQADGHYSGKNQVIEKWVRESLPAISNLKTNVVSSDVDTHLAFEAGTFSVDVIAPNQPSAIGEGNFVFVWKKQADNNWKINFIQLEDLPLQVSNRK
jgi:ketosteroid isomerase-like protein